MQGIVRTAMKLTGQKDYPSIPSLLNNVHWRGQKDFKWPVSCFTFQLSKISVFSDICDGVYWCVCLLCMIVFLIFLGVPGDVGILVLSLLQISLPGTIKYISFHTSLGFSHFISAFLWSYCWWIWSHVGCHESGVWTSVNSPPEVTHSPHGLLHYTTVTQHTGQHFPSSIALTTHSCHQSHIALIIKLITQSHTLYKPWTSSLWSLSIV